MFKHLRYSLLTLLLAVFTGAWAETITETITLSEQGYGNAEAVSSTEGTNFTLTYNRGTGNTAPAYYNTGTGVRVYAGGNVVVSAKDDLIITEVIFTYAKNNSPTVVLDGETVESPATWESEEGASSVQLDVTTKGHIRLQKVEVTFKNDERTPVATDLSFEPLTVEPGESGMFTFSATYAEGATYQVSFESSDEDLFKTYTGDHLGEYTVGFEEGTVTVTVTITPTGDNAANFSAVTEEFVITIEDSRTPVALDLTLSPQEMIVGDEGTLTLGASVLDGCNVTVESTDPTILSISSNGTIDAENYQNAFSYQALAVGTVDVTVTFEPWDDDERKPATKTFTVTVNPDPNGPGQEDNPYTVAQAIEAIDNGGNVNDVYVKGIISQIDEVSTRYGNATYWISDDGTTTTQLEVYRGKYLEGAAFTSADQIGVGDQVVVKGNLILFGDNQIHEFAQGNEITSLVHIVPIATLNSIPTEFQLSDSGEYFALDATFAEGTTEGADNDYTITWISDNPSVLSVFDYDHEKAMFEIYSVGTANITITVLANDNTRYTDVEKTFAVTVVDHFKTDIATITGISPEEVNVGESGVLFKNLEWADPLASVTFNWSSSDNDILNVTPDGDYEALSEGTVDVTLVITPEDTDLYNEVSFTQQVTVKQPSQLRTYQLVTSTDQITDGSKYLIVYEGKKSGSDNTQVAVAFNGSLETLDATYNNVEVNVVNNMIVTDEDIYFIIDGSTLQSASGLYIGVTANSNGLKQSSNAEAYINSFEIDENGYVVIKSDKGPYLRYNYGVDQQRFRYYTQNQQVTVYLYKEMEQPTTVELTIGQRKAAAVSSQYPLDFTNTNVKAYIITGKEGTTFTRQEVTTVPANTGIVITGEEGTYQIPVAAEADEIEGNLLVATTSGEYTVTDEDYGMVYGLFYSTKQQKVGFQKKPAGFVFGANKCFLRLPDASSANEIFFDFDTTAISGIAADVDNTADAYNVNGQKVNASYKGVVIRGGKKFIQK